MSKEDKKNKRTSATENKQRPILKEETTNKKKQHKSVPRSNHKHEYEITAIEPSRFRKQGIELFLTVDNEYFSIEYTCSICDKTKTEYERIFIDKWKEKYEKTYFKLIKENKEIT